MGGDFCCCHALNIVWKNLVAIMLSFKSLALLFHLPLIHRVTFTMATDNPGANAQQEPTYSAVNARDDLEQALTWISFSAQASRTSIMSDSIESFEELKMTTEVEIKEMASGYAKHLANDRHIIFGQRRTMKLKALTHWVQDFVRKDEEPSIDGYTKTRFIKELNEAADRAKHRKKFIEQSAALSKEATPGGLKDGAHNWVTWDDALDNYLSMIPGVLGVPLCYVIRENEEADRTTQHANSVQEAIACIALKGPNFETDARTVHQIILSLVQGQTAEEWIEPLKSKENGQKDYKALKAHYMGEGNTNLRITSADDLKENLRYQGEKVQPFAKFLSRVMKMFNIYHQGNEEMSEDAKIRFLLGRIQYEPLMNTVSNLKISHRRSPMKFQEVANDLAAEVSQTADFKAKSKISALGTGVSFEDMTDQELARDWSDQDFYSLTKEQKRMIREARSHLGKSFKPGNKKKRGNRGRRVSKLKKKEHGKLVKQLEASKKDVDALKVTVAALKVAALKAAAGKHARDDDDDKVPDDAGTHFGGRTSKKAKT